MFTKKILEWADKVEFKEIENNGYLLALKELIENIDIDKKSDFSTNYGNNKIFLLSDNEAI